MSKLTNYMLGFGSILNIAGTKPVLKMDNDKRVAENMQKAWGRVGYALQVVVNNADKQ